MRIIFIACIKNHLDSHWEQWFDRMTVTHTDNRKTILARDVFDQSALHSLLEKIRKLNLILLQVTKVDTDEEKVQAKVGNEGEFS